MILRHVPTFSSERAVFRCHALSTMALGAVLAGSAVLFLGPFALLQTMERQPYSPFPLLALDAHSRTGRRGYLYLPTAIGLISSVYLEYVLLLGVTWCWGSDS